MSTSIHTLQPAQQLLVNLWVSTGQRWSSRCVLWTEGSWCRAPSLAVVCNGDTGTVDLYTGEMKAEPLRQYLAGFADGKKCGGMVRIDAGTDLKSWRVGKLKQVMQTRGWSCQGCVEKDDFISSIQSHLGLVSG